MRQGRGGWLASGAEGWAKTQPASQPALLPASQPASEWLGRERAGVWCGREGPWPERLSGPASIQRRGLRVLGCCARVPELEHQPASQPGSSQGAQGRAFTSWAAQPSWRRQAEHGNPLESRHVLTAAQQRWYQGRRGMAEKSCRDTHSPVLPCPGLACPGLPYGAHQAPAAAATTSSCLRRSSLKTACSLRWLHP